MELHPWSCSRRQFPAIADLSADAHSPGERELLLHVCRCDNRVVCNGLARLVFVVDGAFPDVRGELRLGHLLGHPRLLRNCPEFVVHCVVPEGLAVLVLLLQRGRIFVSCQLSDFSLVAEKIACCVPVVPFFLRFVSVSPLMFLTLTSLASTALLFTSCRPALSLSCLPALGTAPFCLLLALPLSACCWHCSYLPAVGTALLILLRELSRSRSPNLGFGSRMTSARVCFFLPDSPSSTSCYFRAASCATSVWCVPPAPFCGSLQRRGLPVVSPALVVLRHGVVAGPAPVR